MSQIEGQIITKEDIVDYVDKMEIKKVNLGGFDKVDVYVHIQELVKMYGAYTEQELSKQSGTIKKQKEEIEKLSTSEKVESEELAACKAYIQTCETELQSQREEIESLAGDKETVLRLKNEIDMKDSELERQQQELSELTGYKDSAQELQKETEKLKADISKLSYGKRLIYKQDQAVENLEKELEEQKKEADSLRAELEVLKQSAESQKMELQQRIKETEELKTVLETVREHDSVTEEFSEDPDQTLLLMVEELRTELGEKEQEIEEQEEKIQALLQEVENQEQENQKLENQSPEIQESFNYEENIGEILSEARREGQNIIDNARIEAEQEMVKLLNLRVRFKKEKEVYHDWCKKTEAEKEAVEEFLKQLTAQYSDVNQALREVKERADSFNIMRIYQIESDREENTGETTYEKEDS